MTEHWTRRHMLRIGGAALAGLALPDTQAHARQMRQAQPALPTPDFTCANTGWNTLYQHALQTLRNNVQVLPRYSGPVLIEGAEYPGIWQECGPMEALTFRRFAPEAALHSHQVFFALQREDGQLPANNKRSETGFGQIQMVVPIAATAWELASATQNDAFLAEAYAACARWHTWLMHFRNTRGTGLVEGFCTYDTGHDNSPRWKGIPNQCPGKDAKRFPTGFALPRLCPDLSATLYGGHLALASMATALGKPHEAEQWKERANTLRTAILRELYVEDDAAFYDKDANNNFVRVNSDILTRMCGEHIPDRKLFDTLWTRQFANPNTFAAPFPFPSVALNDPQFVRPIPRNSWGGASQALTALRAPRWMEHYNRPAELAHLMEQWCAALLHDGKFRQQMDPLTGTFTDGDLPGYSPACLVLLDFTWRLAGIVEQPQELWWNVRPSSPASQAATFRLNTGPTTVLELRYQPQNGKQKAGATLLRNTREIARIHGGDVRLITNPAGRPNALIGTSLTPQTIHLTTRDKRRSYELKANQTINLG